MCRVAVVFSGKVGRIVGDRDSPTTKMDLTALRMAAFSWNLNALSDSTKVFVHSWDVDASAAILSLLKPVRAAFEQQIWFRAPTDPSRPYSIGESFPTYGDKRNVGLLGIVSMWYSRMRALELVLQYEQDVGERFELILLTRFDSMLCYSGKDLPRVAGGLAGGASGPIDLGAARYQLPGGARVGAAFLGSWIQQVQTHVHLHWHPGRPAFGGDGCKIGSDGEAVGDVPRFGDAELVGTSRALHQLCARLVGNAHNASRRFHRSEAHALLGQELCKLHHTEPGTVAIVDSVRRNASFLQWSVGANLVREVGFARGDAFHAARPCSGPDWKPAECYQLLCSAEVTDLGAADASRRARKLPSAREGATVPPAAAVALPTANALADAARRARAAAATLPAASAAAARLAIKAPFKKEAVEAREATAAAAAQLLVPAATSQPAADADAIRRAKKAAFMHVSKLSGGG